MLHSGTILEDVLQVGIGPPGLVSRLGVLGLPGWASPINRHGAARAAQAEGRPQRHDHHQEANTRRT